MDDFVDLKEPIEVFAIDNLSNNDWRKPIVEFFQNPTGLTDRKVKYKALSYVIIGNELFKKSPDGVLLKFLSDNEAYVAISTVHNGSCAAHQAGHKMKWLLFRQGLYWPEMLKIVLILPNRVRNAKSMQVYNMFQKVSCMQLLNLGHLEVR